MKYGALFTILLTFQINLTFSQSKPRLVIDTQGHSGTVNSLVVTPEGDKLISVSEDKTIRIWDLSNGDLIRTLRKKKQGLSEGFIQLHFPQMADSWPLQVILKITKSALLIFTGEVM